jgi:hypothetical protein
MSIHRCEVFSFCLFQVLQNIDDLFDREEFSAAPDVGWPDCFNSGVFVYRPSVETYEKLLELGLKEGSFDGGLFLETSIDFVELPSGKLMRYFFPSTSLPKLNP